MNRFVALIVAGAMAVLLTACGNNEAPKKPETTAPQAETGQVQQQPATEAAGAEHHE